MHDLENPTITAVILDLCLRITPTRQGQKLHDYRDLVLFEKLRFRGGLERTEGLIVVPVIFLDFPPHKRAESGEPRNDKKNL